MGRPCARLPAAARPIDSGQPRPAMIHSTELGSTKVLRATPETCFWGFFDNALPPILRVKSGDVLFVEALTHQAGDAPDLMMDDGVRAVYDAIAPDKRG